MSEEKRKLFFVWNYVEWGGAQIYFLSIAKRAAEKWDVNIILPRASAPELISLFEQADLKLHFIDSHLQSGSAANLADKVLRQKVRIGSELETYRRIRELSGRSSVVHIEAAPWQSWILLYLLSRLVRRVFVTLHNFDPRPSFPRAIIWRARLAFLSRISNFSIFASNQHTRTNLRPWLGRSLWERIRVTYTSVDISMVNEILAKGTDMRAVRDRHHIPVEKFVVLTVGQFIDRKGRWVLLEAAQKAAKTMPDLVFVWLMPVLPSDVENKRIAEFDVDGAFVPILSRDVGTDRADILSFIASADAFALPSFVEGLPIALLEAMALGVPSISTDAYAIPEAIIDGETGLLISPGSSVELTDAIKRFRDDSKLRASVSAKGRAIVHEKFSEDESARIAMASYEND